MKVVFRADASTKIGIGHIMRRITLAKKLKKSGSDIVFISRNLKGNLNALISKKGFKINQLSAPNAFKKNSNQVKDGYFDWLGVSEIEDAKETVNSLENHKLDWLIVDHYSLGEIWEKELKPYTNNILVIDDIANRNHDCDILLDQNWFKNMESRYNGLLSKNCVQLLGPKYALLRQEFSRIRKIKKKKNKILKRIFIFFGGSDPQNLTGMTLRVLSESEFDHLELDIVLGKNNAYLKEIQKLGKIRGLVNIHIQVDNIASIMQKADLAIGAGGVNTWERICLNIESHVIISAENQKEVNQQLNDHKHISLIGSFDSINSQKLREHIRSRMLKKNFEHKQSDLSSICDGYGADRIVDLMKLSLEDSNKNIAL